MKRVLLKRIFFSYFILASILLIVLGNYLSGVIKDNYILKLKENLAVQSRLIAEDIPVSFQNNLDVFCKEYKNKTGARITIIDSSGQVLGDSDEPSSLMENHSNRPEIMEAETSGMGSSIRFSKTIHKNLFYLALAITKDSQKRFLRMSVPLHDIEVAVRKVKIQILTASFVSLLIVFLIGLVLTGRIVKTIEEIAAFSKEVASGNFRKRLLPRREDELGELTKNVSNMAQELKNRLKQSEEEKHMIEAILMNMSDGLMLTDPKGRIMLSNSALKSLFGIESSIEGKTVMETLRKAELMEAIDRVVETKESISREIEVAYPKELYVMMTAAPYSIRGELSGVVLAFHDVTRLKQLEDIRKDFVANVSHEIKTPITAIKGFAETLLEGALDDRENAYKFLETIKNHSERLNSLVSDLLTLSRIELGDIKIEKETVNLDTVIDSAFETLREKAQSKGLYLKKEIAPGLHEIKADRNRLIQILLNLVDNGIKFTEQGGVTVRVQSSRLGVRSPEKIVSELKTQYSELADFDYIEICVEDTGIGIPKKHLSRLGERFYRVDKARSRELGGTGLGLAIVKHLVKAHGWEMEIESIPGKGTTVKIIIPALT
ncbi:MAG TPA: ATP-binding protein [Thermodesulfovibrionales bacterium]|nr:ATP-binding protein [Thermodesulfovibrionales bacterium]